MLLVHKSPTNCHSLQGTHTHTQNITTGNCIWLSMFKYLGENKLEKWQVLSVLPRISQVCNESLLNSLQTRGVQLSFNHTPGASHRLD